MTDPQLWARLQAVTLSEAEGGPDLVGKIEAGLGLKPGRGAVLWQEHLAVVYLEATQRRRPRLSRLLQDMSEWLAFDLPALNADLRAAAGLAEGAAAPEMTEAETRAAYLAELRRTPVPHVWPRELPGKGRRTARGLGVAFILTGAVWRLVERQIQVEAFHVIPTWLPMVLACFAAAVGLALAPRATVQVPADAWREGEAQA